MNYNPTVDYRSDRAPLTTDASDETRSWMTEVATRVALTIALAVWAVIGFIVWLPLLLRKTAFFIVAVLYAALTNGSPDAGGRRLRTAASFYRRGFQTAFRSVLSARDEGSDTEPSPDRTISARPILLEITWALVVWYPVLLWLGIAELTPADVWNSVMGLPWSETATGLLEAASAVLDQTLAGIRD